MQILEIFTYVIKVKTLILNMCWKKMFKNLTVALNWMKKWEFTFSDTNPINSLGLT